MRRAFFWLVSPVTLVWAAFANAANSDGHSRLNAEYAFTGLADDSFTVEFVPGSFLGTFLTGPRTGQTFTIDNPPLTGLIGKDKKMLTLASVEPTIEIQTHSNGDVWPRICHRSRVLIKLGKSDRD